MAQDNIFSVVCPTDCTSTWVAIEDLNPACAGPLAKSEVNYLYMMLPETGVGPADWTDAAAWATVIDNSDTTGVKVKALPVVGNVPAEERADIPLSNGYVAKGDGTFTLTAKIQPLTAGLYDWLRSLQCPGTSLPKFWFTDRGGNMFGKDVVGIQAKSVAVNFILEEGDESYEYANIILVWEAATFPDRIVSPI